MEKIEEYLKLREPITAIHSDEYLAVLVDANGVRHYWAPDGLYDGYDFGCRDCEDEEEKLSKDIKDKLKDIQETIERIQNKLSFLTQD